jgi:outer membrane protein assembly factor BamA
LKSIISIILFFCIHDAFTQVVQDSFFRVDTIIIQGNRKTHDNIITRELTFRQGDTIRNWPYHQDQSRRQLINLFLFNEIKIDKQGNAVTIHVTERWYLWPYPELDYADRNFSQWLLTHDPKRLTYGLRLEWYNIRGRNETMQFDVIMGYTRMFNFGYKVPYFNKRQTWGAQIFATYSSNKEVWYGTANDKVQFFSDRDRDLIFRKGLELSAIHRKKIFSYHQIYVGALQIKIADTVHSEEVNSNYLIFNGDKQNEMYLGYNYIFDKRDFKGYPLKGYLVKAGIEGGNLSSGLISKRTIAMKGSISRYFRIAGPLYGALNATARHYSLSNPPYSKVRALGYGKDYIRGYELKVIDGNDFVLGKAEIKYRFLNKIYKFMPKVKNYEVLPVALYLTAYTDAGYVRKHLSGTSDSLASTNRLPNTWQYGFGTGLNVVMFYDYCLRAEYSFDKYLNNRLYLSFVASM